MTPTPLYLAAWAGTFAVSIGTMNVFNALATHHRQRIIDEMRVFLIWFLTTELVAIRHSEPKWRKRIQELCYADLAAKVNVQTLDEISAVRWLVEGGFGLCSLLLLLAPITDPSRSAAVQEWAAIMALVLSAVRLAIVTLVAAKMQAFAVILSIGRRPR